MQFDPDGTNIIDAHVGKRIRFRRNMLNITQEQLGDAIGVSLQQIQKYERCDNRVSSSRLWAIARALRVPVSYFFDDMNDIDVKVSPICPAASDPTHRTENIQLIIAIEKLPKPQAAAVRSLVNSMVGGMR